MNNTLQVQVLRPIVGETRKYAPGEVHPATEFRNHVSLAKMGKLRYCDSGVSAPPRAEMLRPPAPPVEPRTVERVDDETGSESQALSSGSRSQRRQRS